MRPEGGRFVANADAVHREIRAHAVERTTAVILDAATVPAVDVTVVTMLVALAEDLPARLARDSLNEVL